MSAAAALALARAESDAGLDRRADESFTRAEKLAAQDRHLGRLAKAERQRHWLGAGRQAVAAGRWEEALWEWSFYLAHHWGEHATSAIRALHCWLSREHPEVLGG